MKNAIESSISSWIKKSDFGRLISFKRCSAAVTAVLDSLKENGWERIRRIIMSDTHNVVPTQVFKCHMGHMMKWERSETPLNSGLYALSAT